MSSFTTRELPRHGPSLAARLALWAALVALVGAAGSHWARTRARLEPTGRAVATITAELRPDGTLAVEERLLVTERRGTGVERLLPAPPGGHVLVRSVSGGDRDALITALDDGALVRVPLDQRVGQIELRYDVTGAVEAGSDAARAHWPITDGRHRLDFADLTVDLSWAAGAGEPSAVTTEPATAAVVAARAGGLRWLVGPVRPGEAAELGVAVGLVAVPELTPGDVEVVPEMRAAAPAPEERRGPLAVALPFVVAAAFLAAWAMVHRRKGREHATAPAGATTSPPSGHPPAEVGWLLRFGATTPADLAGTLLDLEARGVLERQGGRLRRAVDAEPRLRAHERAALEVVLADRLGAAIADLPGEAKADPSAWHARWRAFVASVEEAGEDAGLIERTADAESVLALGLASAVVVVAGAIGVARGRPEWLACIAAGAFVLAFADTLARRTRLGADLAARWQRYAEHLEDAGVAAADAGAAGAGVSRREIVTALPYATVLAPSAAAAVDPEVSALSRALQSAHAASAMGLSFRAGPAVPLLALHRVQARRRRGRLRTGRDGDVAGG